MRLERLRYPHATGGAQISPFTKRGAPGRHVRIEQIKCVGKESNSLEEVESGLIHSEQSVYTEYPDPRRDEWQVKIVPALRRIPLSILEQKSGLSRRMLIYARAGRRMPQLTNRERIAAILRKLAMN
jgi:hypothetical protein